MAKRQCDGKTKAGKPCKAPPLSDSNYCLAHSTEEQRASVGFGGVENAVAGGHASGEARRQPRAIDLLRERLEGDIDRVLAPLFEALDADRGVVVGSGEDATLEHVPDWVARLAAVREILDRAYGKSKQSVEHRGADDGPLAIELRLDETGREALANVLRQRPAASG